MQQFIVMCEKIKFLVVSYLRLFPRCLFTTVDPAKGEKNEDKEPLALLRKYAVDSDKLELNRINCTPPWFFGTCT
jgi:uncharacterized protein YcbX